MTTDDRLDRLTERHEALTQTVELIAGMQRANEVNLAKLLKGMESLVHIAEIHEQRLNGLEGN